MYKAFWEVLKDLWNFALGRDEVVSTSTTKDVPAQTSRHYETAPTQQSDLLGVLGTAYVIVPEAAVFSTTTQQVDSLLKKLPYAEIVTVKSINGEHARIISGDIEGWVPSKFLSEDPAKIIPVLEPGIVYNAANDQTSLLRKYIGDKSSGGLQQMYLQPIEYLLYILKYRKIVSDWKNISSCEAGSLSTIFHGVKNVSAGTEPKTRSLIEVLGSNDSSPFVGLVEEVHPDESIVVTSVGRLLEGEFRKEIFKKTKWKKWDPVFLTFT